MARKPPPVGAAPGGVFASIHALVRRIPPGRVATYGQLARLLGAPRQARVVGWAMRATPRGAGIPWHRVVQQGGGLSPGVAPQDPGRQRRRLEAEGIAFRLDGRVDLAAHQWHPGPAPPPPPARRPPRAR